MLQDHSRCLYLMAPDNKFVAYYDLDLSPQELSVQVMEDISYDIGTQFVGTGNRPTDL